MPRSPRARAFVASFIATACLLAGQTARAADYLLDLNFDPLTGINLLPHADGSVEFDSYPAFAPLTLGSGDHLTLNYTFGGSRIDVTDIAPNNNGIEAFTFSLFPFDQSFSAGIDTTIDLLGVEGSLNGGSRLFSGTIYSNGGISWQVARDLTDSSFSFTGARVDLYFKDVISPITVDSGIVGAYGGAIHVASPAPEPESWAMAMLGLAIVGAFARRRRANRNASS